MIFYVLCQFTVMDIVNCHPCYHKTEEKIKYYNISIKMTNPIYNKTYHNQTWNLCGKNYGDFFSGIKR